MQITPQVREIIDYAQRKIKRVTNEEINLYPVPKEAAAWFTWDDLCVVVCSVTKVKREEIFSGCRKPEIVLARHLIWYYGHLYKFGSLGMLAAKLKAANHTSPFSAIKKIKGLLETGDDIVFNAAEQIDQLLEQLKPKEPVDIPF